MKIAQVTAIFPPYRGGIGQVAWQYAKGLSQLGESVEVFTIDYGIKNEFAFKCHYLKAWPRWGKAGFCPQLLWRLDKFAVVQLHYPAFGLAEVVAIWRKLNKNKKLIVFYHHDLVGQGWLGKFFWLYQKFFLPWLLKQADVILVSSFDYLKSSEINFYYQNNQEKFIALPFAPDEIFVPPTDKKMVQKNILFVGGLDRNHYFKGVGNLIKACSNLTNENWRLIIVGSGELMTDYKNLAGELNIDKKVWFTGQQTNDELLRLYQSAYVFCLPSIDKTEAFGIVLLEAMACGVPTIASNLPGVRSVVSHEQTGLLVKPNSVSDLAKQLDFLLTHEELQQRWGLQARTKVENYYNWVNIIKNLRDIYYV